MPKYRVTHQEVQLNLAIGALMIVLLLPQSVLGQIESLFGTWQGTWFVDEQFSSSGPYGTHPYPPADVTFQINEFDPDRHNYGQMSVAGAYGGEISAVSLDAADVNMTVVYPTVSPDAHATLTAQLVNNDLIQGDLDDSVPPSPGLISWRGPISLSRVDTQPPGPLFVSSSPGSLWRVDTNGAARFVGNMGATMADIAFSPSGELFGVSYDDLYEIDPMTAQATLRGSSGYENITSLAFDANGTLYFGTFGWTSRLGTLDLETGHATLRPNTVGHTIGGDLAFAPNGDLFASDCQLSGFWPPVCSDSASSQLIKIDPVTGAGQSRGRIGFPRVYGMDFVGDTLFGITYQGELISISTQSGAGTLVANTTPTVRATGASFSGTPVPDCEIPVDRFSQADPLWASNQYDHTTDTIQQMGCALTSLCMALNHAGIDGWSSPSDGTDVENNPGTLNVLMQNSGGYTGSLVDWFTATRIAADYAGISNMKFNGLRTSSAAIMEDIVCSQGHPVIVGVDNNTHFVLVTGKQGSSFSINDPAYPERTTLEAYNNQFETRGYVADPLDISELNISVVAAGEGVSLLVADPAGFATGFDPVAGQRVEGISRSVHFIDAIADDVTGDPATETAQLVHVFRPIAGEYLIDVTGIDAQPTPYSLFVSSYAADGSQQALLEITGIVGPDSIARHTIAYRVPEPSACVMLWVTGLFGLSIQRKRKIEERSQ